MLDTFVNFITLVAQLFLTGRLVKRFGVAATLAAIPVFMIFGFSALGFVGYYEMSAPVVLAVFSVVQVLRRAGNYAATRPAREMLFTVLDRETKYKAKNVIDTLTYRGGDVLSGWFFKGLGLIGLGLAGTAFVGAAVAAVWGYVAVTLGRAFAPKSEAAERHDAFLQTNQSEELPANIQS
jgi:AAA family ATP:ADP antiporter